MATDSYISVKRGYPLNMAYLFRIYLRWCFMNMITEVIIVLIVAIVYQFRPTMALYQCVAFTAATLISSVFNFFLGMLWRFSSAGKLASGDFIGHRSLDESQADWDQKLQKAGYQLDSGLFIKRLLYVHLIWFTTLGMLSCGFCCWISFFKRAKEDVV